MRPPERRLAMLKRLNRAGERRKRPRETGSGSSARLTKRNPSHSAERDLVERESRFVEPGDLVHVRRADQRPVEC